MELLQVVQSVDSLYLKPLDTIAENTAYTFTGDGWNLVALISLIIAFMALTIEGITFRAQRKTEKNTKKLSKPVQQSLLEELYRHLYRNMVIIYTVKTKLEDIEYKGYPSEEHLLKLKIPMENLQLNIFYGDDKKYKILHDLYLKLRNYNTEVDVAVSHFKDERLLIEVKRRDLDTLIMKSSFLTKSIINTIRSIWEESEESALNKVKEMIIASRKTNAESFPIENDTFTKYENTNNVYVESVYKNELDGTRFLDEFNNDVLLERGLNKENNWKVYIIKFIKQ